MSDSQLKRKTEAFFGRRHGKRLRESQSNHLATLLPTLLLDVNQAPPRELLTLFPSRVEGICLDIGFGGGEQLFHKLGSCKHLGFIGVEPFINGMASFLAKLASEDEPQQRVKLFNDDATIVLDWLPDASLDTIDLFYPDPWPKKRHWKRRFVNERNVLRFARVLKPGGSFRFVSDIADYVDWALLYFARADVFTLCARDTHIPFNDWVMTRYEAKAFREDRRPQYLSFRRE